MSTWSAANVISYLCGYPSPPMPSQLLEIVRRCLSLPGGMGYIPALALIALAVGEPRGASGFYPVPFYAVGRIRRVCVLDPKVFESRIESFTTILGFEVSYRSTGLSDGRRIAEPEGFALLVEYEDSDGALERRAYAIARSMARPAGVAGRYAMVELPARLAERVAEECSRTGGNPISPDEYYAGLAERLGAEAVEKFYIVERSARAAGEPEEWIEPEPDVIPPEFEEEEEEEEP